MKYELMVILSPKQTDKEIEKNLKEIKAMLTDNGFDLVDEDIWGLRDLAYRMAGNTKGHYAVLNFAGETDGVQEIHKDLRIQAGVLRYMLVKVPDDYVLLRYDQLATTGKAAKLSSPAEELSKKVRSQTRGQTRGQTRSQTDGEAKGSSQGKTPETSAEKLDETLKAIIEDKDIGL